MPDFNLSPEEILREKEIRGGIKYDDPDDLNLEPVQPELDPNLNIYEERVQDQKAENPRVEEKSIQPVPTPEFREQAPLDLGWKNLPLGMLPSKGLFYPENSRIAIR